MQKFDKATKTHLDRAIYQEQPYVVITPDQEIKVSLKGDLNQIENGLREAMQNTPALRKIIISALRKPEPAPMVRTFNEPIYSGL